MFPFKDTDGAVFKTHMDRTIVENGQVVKVGRYPRTLLGGDSHHNAVFSSFWVSDASYLRMKNLQIGYTLPGSLSNKIKLTKAAKAWPRSWPISAPASRSGRSRREVALGRGILERGRALLALEQQLHATQSTLDLADPGNDAHRVQDVRRRLVGIVTLRNGEDETVALQRRFDRAQRPRSPGRDRGRETRKDHGPAKREDR